MVVMSELTLLKISRPDISDNSSLGGEGLCQLLRKQMNDSSYAAVSGAGADFSLSPEAQDLVLSSVANLDLLHDRVVSGDLFALRAWFAQKYGPDCAVALAKDAGKLVVLVFSDDDQPAECGGLRVVTCPLAKLDEFSKISIIRGADNAIVCHVPFAEFGLAGGYPGPLCIRVDTTSEITSVLGLKVVGPV